MSNEIMAGDNRFEIIAKAKRAILDGTNIDTSEDEMKVLDSILFRCWQMGWLDKYDDTKEQTGWIPCSERLPSDNREVLISCEWGLDIGEHDNDGWRSEWINHYDDDNVLAWMYLPEPWKGGEEE